MPQVMHPHLLPFIYGKTETWVTLQGHPVGQGLACTPLLPHAVSMQAYLGQPALRWQGKSAQEQAAEGITYVVGSAQEPGPQSPPEAGGLCTVSPTHMVESGTPPLYGTSLIRMGPLLLFESHM